MLNDGNMRNFKMGVRPGQDGSVSLCCVVFLRCVKGTPLRQSRSYVKGEITLGKAFLSQIIVKESTVYHISIGFGHDNRAIYSGPH